MASANAYRFYVAEGWEDIDEWWYSSINPFKMCGIHDLGGGEYLLMENVDAEVETKLEAASWCASYSLCRVDSPTCGDTEPEGDHETVDGGDQLLWVS